MFKRKKKEPKPRKKKAEETRFDASKFYLGRLCKLDHEFLDTGKGLRRKNSRSCTKCLSQSRTQLSPDKLVIDFADHPDVFKALLNQAAEELREPAQEVIYIIRKLQRLGKADD